MILLAPVLVLRVAVWALLITMIVSIVVRTVRDPELNPKISGIRGRYTPIILLGLSAVLLIIAILLRHHGHS